MSTKLEGKRREDSTRELPHFNPVDERQPERTEWVLPSSCRWDAEGGPIGLEFRTHERFGGIVERHYNPEDFDNRVDESPLIIEQKGLILKEGSRAEVHRVYFKGKVLARKRASTLDWQMTTPKIRALKKINHIHIAQLVGIYVIGTDLYTFSYPVAEMTLRQYLDLVKDERQWVTRYNTLIGGLGCLSSGLAYLHSLGLAHKDIHGDNILVIGSCVLFGDFGVTNISKHSKMPQLTRGGFSDSDPRVDDVWYLGLLFQLILDSLNASFYMPLPESFNKESFKLTMSSGPKSLDSTDVLSLAAIMTADDERVQPTASSVAEYLRQGSVELLRPFDTCGECCKRGIDSTATWRCIRE